MNEERFKKEAQEYIEASQKLKAAEEVLRVKRETLIPAFKKFLKPDEKGNRALEFGNSKIALVPNRRVDEESLRVAIGPDAVRFTQRILTVSSHLIRANEGSEAAEAVEEAVREAIRDTLGKLHLPPKVVQVHTGLDTEAALAYLPKAERMGVKEIVTYSLRPYPEKKGYKNKVAEASRWLNGK